MKSISLLLCFLITAAAVAQEEPSSEMRLEQIRAEVEAQSEQLEKFREQILLSKRSIQRADQALSDTAQKVNKSSAELERLEKEKKKLDSEIAQKEKHVHLESEFSLRRIRALYMSGDDFHSAGLLQQAVGGGFMRTSYYLSKIRSSDRSLLRNLSESIQEYEAKKEQVAVILGKQADLHKQLQQLQSDRERQLSQRKTKYQELLGQQESVEKAMLALEAQALRLQTVLSSLTESGSTFLASTGQNELTRKKSEERKQVEGFQGEGLSKSGPSAALLPVSGKVEKDYGKRKHEKFSDMIFQKGIEFGAPPETEVQAIAEGKVMYRGQMPAYGNIVILDHGQRVYSLYGRLQTQSVLEVGSVVRRGQVLGRTSEDSFYFETRKNGKPVDPQNYYREQFAVGKVVTAAK